MVLIYWIAAYALQMDYVYMLGHVPTTEDPVVSRISTSVDGSILTSDPGIRCSPSHCKPEHWQIHRGTRSFIPLAIIPSKFIHSQSYVFTELSAQILHLPIFAFISVTLAFFILCVNYIKVHRLWRDRGIYSSEPNISPSFLQGPTSALLVFAAIIHIPSTLVILIKAYHPNANLDAIEWPLACWFLIVNVIGSQVATRRGLRVRQANQANNALHLQISEHDGDAVETRGADRTIPVDLAAVLGLFWGTLAVAAGTGSVNCGPVMVIGYIGTLWQALALFGSIGEQ
jgi:hypothetical protein